MRIPLLLCIGLTGLSLALLAMSGAVDAMDADRAWMVGASLGVTFGAGICAAEVMQELVRRGR